MEPRLTRKEAAHLLGWRERRVGDWIARRKIRVYPDGLIPLSEIQAILTAAFKEIS